MFQPGWRRSVWSQGVTLIVQYLGRLWKWLKWPVALGILAWLYWQNSEALEQIAQGPKEWGWLLLAVGMIGGATLITFFRWYLLVRGQKIPFRVRDALRLGFVGLLSNYIAPGSVGGDIVKAFLLAREHPTRRTVAVASVLLDRILGLLALFMVGAVASLLPIQAPDTPELRAVPWLLWGGSLGGLTGVGLMLIPRLTRLNWVRRMSRLPLVGRAVGELITGIELYQTQPGVLLGALGLSVLGHAGLIGGFFCCALWMRQPWIPDLTTHFFFMPIAELFGVLIPTPGGVGALEEAIKWFYVNLSPAGVTIEQAAGAGLMAALAFRVVTVGIAAIGGAYYFTARREIAAALHDAELTPEESA
ncbi:MAG: lysylphosphatidylglycerol synthase transmembrane domain-containing protein [Planctomycetales bacterium]